MCFEAANRLLLPGVHYCSCSCLEDFYHEEVIIKMDAMLIWQLQSMASWQYCTIVYKVSYCSLDLLSSETLACYCLLHPR